MNRFVPIALASVCLVAPAHAQISDIVEGRSLPVISATAATGRWLERAAFNPETYGKTRGVSPATSREPKVVLYTTTLSEDFFKIALAVDKFVGEHPELAWSFVQVSDPRGAQLGGYTPEELAARLAQIKELVQQHGIQHLSFLVAAPGRAPENPPTVTLAHVRPNETKAHPVVDWTLHMNIAQLQGNLLINCLDTLDGALRSPIKVSLPSQNILYSVVHLRPDETKRLEFSLASPVFPFRPEGQAGRDFLRVRRANPNGQDSALGASYPPFTGVPGLDVLWEKDQPAISLHAQPSLTPGTYDLVFTYQSFGGGTSLTGVRVIVDPK